MSVEEPTSKPRTHTQPQEVALQRRLDRVARDAKHAIELEQAIDMRQAVTAHNRIANQSRVKQCTRRKIVAAQKNAAERREKSETISKNVVSALECEIDSKSKRGRPQQKPTHPPKCVESTNIASDEKVTSEPQPHLSKATYLPCAVYQPITHTVPQPRTHAASFVPPAQFMRSPRGEQRDVDRLKLAAAEALQRAV